MGDLGGFEVIFYTFKTPSKNPNTPIKTLERLSNEFYEEVIDNPVFELLLLENCDRHFLKWCLAKSDRTSVETLEKLSCENNFEIHKAITKNPNISAKIIDKYATDENICKLCIRDLIKHVNKISPETWSLLANHSNIDIRWQFAHYALAPIDIMVTLANDRNERVRSNLVSNRYIHLPVHILAMLAQDPVYFVRRAVAYNFNTPVNVLRNLARDEHSWVHRALADNPNTPADVLRNLAQKANSDTRCAVARNPNTPVDVLANLARDEHLDIHFGSFDNFSTLGDIRHAATNNLRNRSGN